MRLLAVVALVLGLCAGPAYGDAFTVDSDGDDLDGQLCTSGDCTLREAMIAANAAAGNDSINLGGRTVTLTIPGDGTANPSGDLDVNQSGGVATITISGGKIVAGQGFGDRIFDVASSNGLNLNGVSLEGGDVVGNPDPADDRGGQIRSRGNMVIQGGTFTGGRAFGSGGSLQLIDGTTSVTSATFSDNAAIGGGAIHAGGTSLTVNGSAFEGNDAQTSRGGAIDHVGGDLNVFETRFTLNEADLGGAIAVEAGAAASVLDSSSLFENTADSGGGGVFAQSTFTVRNTTVAANSAGGASARGGGLDIGLPQGEEATIHHVTLAGNTAPAGDQVNIGGGEFEAINTIVSGDCALSANGTTQSFGSSETGSSCGFLHESDTRNATIRLGALDPSESLPVLALLGGSAAIDTAFELSCTALDQRGVARPADECDAGAFEALKTDLSATLGVPFGAVAGADAPVVVGVRNEGPRPTGGVIVTLTRPAGVEFVSGAGCTDGEPITCSFGALEPGEAASVTVSVRPAAAGTFAFAGHAVGDLAELTPGNESPTAELVVSPAPPATDTTDPAVTVALIGKRVRKIVRTRRLRLRVTTDEACVAGIVVRLGRKRLAGTKGLALEPGTTRVVLKLSRKAARKLQRSRKRKLRLALTCADAAGNTATLARAVGVKRPTRR